MSKAPENAKWYAGRDEEYFTEGPFDTREDAIAEGKALAEDYDQTYFHVAHAAPTPIRLSADRMIDDQYFESEDLFSYDHGPEAGRKGDAEAADAELQAYIDDWLVRHKDTFVQPTMFGYCKDEVVDLKDLT